MMKAILIRSIGALGAIIAGCLNTEHSASATGKRYPWKKNIVTTVFWIGERPKPKLNKGAGLDVSPAVRDYLELNETDVTDWRFVEFSEISRGPWSALGENNTFVISDRKTGKGIGRGVKARAEGRAISR